MLCVTGALPGQDEIYSEVMAKLTAGDKGPSLLTLAGDMEGEGQRQHHDDEEDWQQQCDEEVTLRKDVADLLLLDLLGDTARACLVALEPRGF